MVLLSAAIVTKSGKALVARQFMEVTRSRVEGLLAAFPKLINADEQHTFVETDTVRYVYQPLDALFMVLITTKNSNIMEDLETLRLFAKVVPEYCKTASDSEISAHAFELIFAFDEIVALGYRESVNLHQIKTFTEMDSHDENIARMVKKNKEREAHEHMKRKAKELTLQKKTTGSTTGGFGSTTGHGGGGGGPSGFGSGGRALSVSSESGAGSTSTGTGGGGGSADSSMPALLPVKKAPGRGMKLGGKSKGSDFMDEVGADAGAGADVGVAAQSTGRGTGAAGTGAGHAVSGGVVGSSVIHGAPAPHHGASVHTEGLHVRIDEKITFEGTRDGALEQLEVKGIMQLVISDPALQQFRVLISKDETLANVAYTVHPNVDKKTWVQDSAIASKSADKPFPVNTEVNVLKWRYQSTDDSGIPFAVNCWPTVNANGSCDVNIDFELRDPRLSLEDVTVSVPVPGGGGAPVVAACDGAYDYSAKAGVLVWRVPLVDSANKEGSMEFSVAARSADDFFPISVSFSSSKSFAGVKVLGAEPDTPVSSQVSFTADKYEFV